jgi:hypothetical protein
MYVCLGLNQRIKIQYYVQIRLKYVTSLNVICHMPKHVGVEIWNVLMKNILFL